MPTIAPERLAVVMKEPLHDYHGVKQHQKCDVFNCSNCIKNIFWQRCFANNGLFGITAAWLPTAQAIDAIDFVQYLQLKVHRQNNILVTFPSRAL